MWRSLLARHLTLVIFSSMILIGKLIGTPTMLRHVNTAPPLYSNHQTKTLSVFKIRIRKYFPILHLPKYLSHFQFSTFQKKYTSSFVIQYLYSRDVFYLHSFCLFPVIHSNIFQLFSLLSLLFIFFLDKLIFYFRIYSNFIF